jgi:hypothetical protein
MKKSLLITAILLLLSGQGWGGIVDTYPTGGTAKTAETAVSAATATNLANKILRAVAKTQFNVTNSQTLVQVPDLTVTLEAGKTYVFTARLETSSDSSTAGTQVGLAGTCTPAIIRFRGIFPNAPDYLEWFGGAKEVIPSLAAQAAGTSLPYLIEGFLTVAAGGGGALYVTFAQKTQTAGKTASLLVGSSFTVQEMP